ncbi:hypothetical protein TorRG33x02_240900 [Trema orientale]|uniref:Uncharacterized protein n=1 Tax=Trema orientale TaxID=63057 RepID=A0A2P5DV03_TREOI|nr:hypothetical protein TorRG33x02_240900 [Trema orientale]
MVFSHPKLLFGLVLNCFGRASVHQVNCLVNYLSQKFLWKFLLMKHGFCHLHHSLILSLRCSFSCRV